MTSESNEAPQDAESSGDRPSSLSGVMDHMLDSAEGDEVSIAEVMHAFDSRTYGPLLVIPGLVVVLPTGGIPGMPLVMGAFIALMSVQMLVSRRKPWIPKRLAESTVGRERLEKYLGKARPWAVWFDGFMKERLVWMADGPMHYAVALACAAMGGIMPFLELVPFAAAAPGLAVLLFGLGLIARDGAALLVGFAASGGTVYLMVAMSNKIFG